MTPVYMSHNMDQIKVIEQLLLDHKIATSVVSKKKHVNSDHQTTSIWYELWLKDQRQTENANSLITQEEFRLMQNNMKTNKSPGFVNTQRIHSVKQYHKGPIHKDPISKPQADTLQKWVPVNLISVFKRLGALLGLSEEEIAQSKFNKLYRPWDSQPLLDSVERLRSTTKTLKNNGR